jgi:hypothetical protein
MPSQRALREAEGGGYFSLCGVTGVNQQDHPIRLGHGILDAVVVHSKSCNNDYAVLAFALQNTARVDHEEPWRHRCRQRKFLLGGHALVLHHIVE